MRLTLVLSSDMWSYKIIRRAPKKIRLAFANIDGVNNILIAI